MQPGPREDARATILKVHTQFAREKHFARVLMLILLLLYGKTQHKSGIFFRYTNALAADFGGKKRSFVSAFLFFQTAELDGGHKKKDVHEGLSVLRFAAGSSRNDLLRGTVFRFCVYRRTIIVCVCARCPPLKKTFQQFFLLLP